MMLNRKRPLRTYERKTAKKPFTNLLPSPVILIRKYNPVENEITDDSQICNDSLLNDPFETTFDKIAKEAVVPSIPLDNNQNNSWEGISSDSDINNSINAIKSHRCADHDLFTCNGLDVSSHSYTPNNKLIHKRITRKRKKLPKNELKVVVSKGIVSKKTTVIQKDKKQKWKRQENEKQRKRVQSKSRESSCNKQTFYTNSSDTNNSKDTARKSLHNILHNNKHLHKRVSKLKNTSQTELIKTNSTITAFNYTSNCQQNIKPCFVKLDACTIQNYLMDDGKAMGAFSNAKQDLLSEVKCLSDITNTLDAEKDISKGHNVLSQPILNEFNILGKFKHLSIKDCFVVLNNDIVKNWISKTEKNISGSVDIENESNVPHLTLHNLSASCNTNNVELVRVNTKKNNGKLIKDSIVKMERLKIKEFEKDDICREKERYIISSTPISKRVKSYASSTFFSPINTNIRNAQCPRNECSISSVENISNIVLSDQNDSPSSIMPSKYDFDMANINEDPTQGLAASPETQFRCSTMKIKVSFEEDIYTLPMQKYKQSDMIKETSACSLNVLSVANTDSSLFSDTTHDYSLKNKTDECKISKIHLTNTSISDEITHATNSSVDLFLEQKQINDNANTKDGTVDSNKGSFLSESQDVNNTVLLARLQDSIRITEKRVQYPKWHLSIQLSKISKNSSCDEVTESNNKIFKCDAMDDTQSEMCNFENPINALKRTLESLVDSAQLSDNTHNVNKVEKSVFLKPGKCWARSLSILNCINDQSNLDKLSLGKGKRWRHSVRDILDMQKQGIFQSCLKKDKDDVAVSCKELDTLDIIPSFNNNKCKTLNSPNYPRLSKRISVRVVPNSTSTGRCKIKDTSFLEAFGIKSEKSSSFELSHRKESYDNRIIKKYSTTARNVVLQRCSQNSYLSFSHCFPDSYLEHCRKIGEGVYGEVFLYECLNKKSVIKIIPIEGEKLVNGEPQKKFNEILSEIVIAKELDNLRLNTTYQTSGFVEVLSIKCIVGKYPEKLVELWNTYDDNKTSDNDCPSMFAENQLYIALELGDGGEDLEAFVFQTAEEACALFLQTAFALAVAEKALEFEHRDLHWGNVLISRTKETYVSYNLDGKEIRLPSRGVKVSIIDFTLSRMLYQGCCIYNDLALDPALFTAHGEYQFEIYRLMREKIQNNWSKFEPYTNVLWLHYTLDKMITAVRYKRKNLKVHKQAIARLKEFKDIILNYDSAFDFATDSSVAHL